jgi:hypothetical protein
MSTPFTPSFARKIARMRNLYGAGRGVSRHDQWYPWQVYMLRCLEPEEKERERLHNLARWRLTAWHVPSYFQYCELRTLNI